MGVLIYVFSLKLLFEAARKVLTADGVFAFSTESTRETEGEWVERSSERFAHSRAFVLRMAHGFALESVEEVAIRLDGDEGPILGDVFVLRKLADDSTASE